MKDTDIGVFKRYVKITFILVSCLILSYLMYLVFLPFFGVLLMSLIMAFIFYPIYRLLRVRLKNENISSLVTCILVLLLFVMPTIVVIGALVQQSVGLYNFIDSSMPAIVQKMDACNDKGFVCIVLKHISSRISTEQAAQFFEEGVKSMTNFIITHGSRFVKGFSGFIISLFLLFLGMFYLLKDGKFIYRQIYRVIPIKDKYKNEIITEFEEVIYAAVYGIILTSVIQGILAGIGFYFINIFFDANIPSPFFLGALLALFSLIPFVGTALVWLPLSLIQLFSGNITAGVILLIFGGLIIASIDNIVKPKVIGTKARLHPLLVFLSVFGGVSAFGFIGLILGPFLVALGTVIFNILQLNKHR